MREDTTAGGPINTAKTAEILINDTHISDERCWFKTQPPNFEGMFTGAVRSWAEAFV